ncbi:MAG TPA: aminotransferase class IV, partial [Pyrinomonadaceae bacterium]|nr:aminotransferase class IV [Pyrinomonadaceae bacterium]
MHSHVVFNNRVVEAERAHVSPFAAGPSQGRGVFTTLAVHAGRPFAWSRHWSRLSEHAEGAGVRREGFEEETTRAALARLIEANGVVEGRARVMLLGRASRGAWGPREARGEPQTDLLIATADARPQTDETLALTVSPYRANTHSPLAGLKTVGYLEHVLAWEEARARDFDEAVVLNERGEVTSATTANIFWVKHGTLHTPALSTACVAGVVRALVLELAGELAVPHVEGVSELSALADADEIFLTSSSLGLRLVTAFDFHRYSIPVGSVAVRL